MAEMESSLLLYERKRETIKMIMLKLETSERDYIIFQVGS